MASKDEIPTDKEVREAIQQLGEPTASELVTRLVDGGHERRDAQRAVQRCIDRRSIKLGSGMRLTVNALPQAA